MPTTQRRELLNAAYRRGFAILSFACCLFCWIALQLCSLGAHSLTNQREPALPIQLLWRQVQGNPRTALPDANRPSTEMSQFCSTGVSCLQEKWAALWSIMVSYSANWFRTSAVKTGQSQNWTCCGSRQESPSTPIEFRTMVPLCFDVHWNIFPGRK